MPFAMHFDGEECPKCGEEELLWWREDETEDTIEVYMNCHHEDGCGYEFPKIFVSKSEDTSDEALKERLRDRHL